jgi:hypothetical protein
MTGRVSSKPRSAITAKLAALAANSINAINSAALPVRTFVLTGIHVAGGG